MVKGIVDTFFNISAIASSNRLPHIMLPYYADYSILLALANTKFNYFERDFISPSSDRFATGFQSGNKTKNILLSDTTYNISHDKVNFREAGKTFSLRTSQGKDITQCSVKLSEGFPNRENLKISVEQAPMLAIAGNFLSPLYPYKYEQYYLALCVNPVLIISDENSIRQKDIRSVSLPSYTKSLDPILADKYKIISSVGLGSIEDVYRRPILVDSATGIGNNSNYIAEVDFSCIIFEGISQYRKTIIGINSLEDETLKKRLLEKVRNTPKIIILSWRSKEDVKYSLEELFDSSIEQTHNIAEHNTRECGAWIYIEDIDENAHNRILESDMIYDEEDEKDEL